MSEFATRLEEAAKLLNTDLSGLSDQQFNWKPAADSWSIAQCILHLVKTNKSYLGIYEKFATGTYERTWWEKVGLFNSFWAKFFINGTDPNNVRKWKAPAVVQPTQSHIAQTISEKLLEQNGKFLGYYEKLGNSEHASLVISSPLASVITYPLSTTFEVISLHELRHLQQALRVKNNPQFPK
jgi:hypothetical protein